MLTPHLQEVIDIAPGTEQGEGVETMLKDDAAVLVVEDEPLVASLLEIILTDMGHRTLPLPNSPEEAQASIEGENVPDCVILDINLWGSDGYRLARLALARNIPVALTSGYTANQVNEEFSHLPYLPKPFTDDEVERLLDRLLTPSGV